LDFEYAALVFEGIPVEVVDERKSYGERRNDGDAFWVRFAMRKNHVLLPARDRGPHPQVDHSSTIADLWLALAMRRRPL
jgi:hypothetical protein